MITERDLIRSAIIDFRKQWGDGSYGGDDRGIAVGLELSKLDADAASVEQVNELIGNSLWTEIKCNECGNKTSAAIMLGEDPGYGRATSCICFECIRKASEMTHNDEWKES